MSVEKELIACKKYISLHNSAKSRNLEFNLTVADVKKLMFPKECYYSGIILETPNKDDEGAIQYNARTIDRIDNTAGYVKGNVVACCHLINYLKAVFIEKTTSLTAAQVNMLTSLPLDQRSAIFLGLAKASNELQQRLESNELPTLP